MSLRDKFLLLDEHEQEEMLSTLDLDTLLQIAREEWWWVQRPEQVPPPGDWSIHLFLAGRGCGKTKAGSEWIVERMIQYPHNKAGFPVDRLVMAYNLADCKNTCIEGDSGILRILDRRGYTMLPAGRKVPDNPEGMFTYVASPKPKITMLDTGTKLHFSGADPDAARGANLADVWCDEIVKWAEPEKVWAEGIRPALRADIPGDKPRAFVTTTPKSIVILQEWLAKTEKLKISVVRGSTFDNAINLSEDFLIEVKDMYEGTNLGRQELYGEMLEGLEGILFSYDSIEKNRVSIGPEKVAHRVVGVDPGLTGAEGGDFMGVVVACRDADDHAYIVADKTIRVAGRDAAIYCWRVFEQYGCDTLVYENNLGRAWMEQVFTDAYKELQAEGLFPENTSPPIIGVTSNQGKQLRAEPVAMRYSQGRVHHIGKFEELEKQMLGFDPLDAKNSPDRLDAMVHAVRHLMAGEKRKSRVFSPVGKTIGALDRKIY